MNTHIMLDIEKFLEPYNLDDSRYAYFEYIVDKLFKLNRPILVVETGTMWADLKTGIVY